MGGAGEVPVVAWRDGRAGKAGGTQLTHLVLSGVRPMTSVVNLDQAIAAAEQRRTAALARRDAASRGVAALLASCQARGQAPLTGAQSAAAEGWQEQRAEARGETAPA